jgi:hypothetical protein
MRAKAIRSTSLVGFVNASRERSGRARIVSACCEYLTTVDEQSGKYLQALAVGAFATPSPTARKRELTHALA